jgi:hypothetical protein
MKAWTLIAAGGLTAGCSGGPQASSGLDMTSGGVPTGLETPAASAPGLCAVWTVRTLDLSALPPPSSTASLAAETDGRGGVTLSAVPSAGSLVAMAITSDGSSGPAVTLAPPAPGDAGAAPFVVQVEAAPDGTWVTTWDVAGAGNGPPTILRHDSHGDVSQTYPWLFPASSDDSYGVCAVGQDDSIGCAGGDDVGWYLPGQPTPTVVGGNLGGAAGVWSNGLFTFGNASVPGIGSIASDGSFVDFPAASVLASGDVLVPGVGGRSAMVLTSSGDPASPVLEVASTTTPPQTFPFASPGAYLMTAVPRAASNGAVAAWVADGSAPGSGSTAWLAEVAPDGATGATIELATELVPLTNLVVAGSSDGDVLVAVGWNAGVLWARVATCSGG